MRRPALRALAMRVYLAGPVRAPRSQPDVVPLLRRVVESFGHEVVGEDRPLPSPPAAGLRAVFEAEFDALQQADLLVADATDPSHGVGWKVAWMLAKGRLVVLALDRRAVARASPTLIGNPSPWQRVILHDGPADLEKQLSALLA